MSTAHGKKHRLVAKSTVLPCRCRHMLHRLYCKA